jgi:glycosyltransferase involved in cell wall biosynthesis
MRKIGGGGSTRPIQAAFLSPGLLLGGAERWLVSLVKYSDPARLCWTGVAISGWGGADPTLCAEVSRYTVLHCQAPIADRTPPARPFDLTYFDGIHDDWPSTVECVCRNADVIVAWGSVEMGNWTKQFVVPRVLVSHTTEQENPARPVRGVTHLAAVSEAAAGFFGNRGAEDLPLSIIYNGADRSRCGPRHGRTWQRKQWGLKPTDVALGYVGRQSPEKNYMAVASSVDYLPPRYKAIYHGATVNTPGVPADDLLKFSQQRPGRVIIRPPQPDVGDILAGLDAFVLASHREAFSLGLIEAWLAGVPVVATPVGSLPELQRAYGPLVTEVPLNPTPQELAQAVQRALTPEGRQIAAVARQIARREFTCEAMAERWMTYLEQVVAGVTDPQPLAVGVSRLMVDG